MASKILFISSTYNQQFAQILMNVLEPYAKLELCNWQAKIELSSYALVFLDAGILIDLENTTSLTEMIQQLLHSNPDARIVVTTASPTWRRARECLKAGAVDYVSQSLDPVRLYNDLRSTLGKYLLEGNRDGEYPRL